MIRAGAVKPVMKADGMKDNADNLSRPDLSNHRLLIMLPALVVSIVAYLLIKPGMGPGWQRAGTVIMQSLAIAGTLLLLMPFVFSLGKRHPGNSVNYLTDEGQRDPLSDHSNLKKLFMSGDTLNAGCASH